MRVALIGAEFEENLAVRYLRGALEHAGHEVVQIVFNEAEDVEWAAEALVATRAELAALSMVFTYRAREFAAVATRARALGFSGHIIVGGHFATFHAEELLRDVAAIDSVGCGEGESLLCELASAAARPQHVPGLVWRDGPRLLRNAPAQPLDCLDQLPFPPRKRPLDTYLGIPITNMLGSRGCNHGCSFCSIAAWHRHCGGARLRLRAPEGIAEEMAERYADGARIFNFHDDNFFLDDRPAMLARMQALRDALSARGVGKIAFAAKARPDSLDRALLEELKAMGLFRLFLGIEAGSHQSLRDLGRGQRLSDNVQALRLVGELELHACFNLLMFNPDSTLEDVASNVEFLRSHPHNPMNFCRTEVYTGTPLEARLRRAGRLLGDYWGWDYEIGDSRAQAAFEVVSEVFRTRNYGAECLHHVSMDVDYELQLLAHFYGARRALRREAKAFVVEVNLNTVEHLEVILHAMQGGRPGAAALEELTRTRGAALADDNERLSRKGFELLARIRAEAERVRGRPGWMRKAAVAGLAAAIAVAAGSCKDRSHATETVARPPATADGPPEPTFATETVAAPPLRPDAGAPALDAGADSPTDAYRDATAEAARDAAGKAPPAPTPTTHRHEMAPRPPRTTHPSEEAPMRPGRVK